MTREEWLIAFTDKARPIFEAAGYTIPDNIRMSIGFTSKGARGKRIGECWVPDASDDNAVEIFIDPKLSNASRIADVLTHELIHATGIRGHKADFSKCMKALGLTGKPTATIAGPEWHEWADPIIEEIGPLPHAAINPGPAKKTQTTRMLKCECTDCGFVFRTTAKWLEATPDVQCPNANCCGPLDIG